MKDGNDGTFSSSGIQKRSSTKRIEKKKEKIPSTYCQVKQHQGHWNDDYEIAFSNDNNLQFAVSSNMSVN